MKIIYAPVNQQIAGKLDLIIENYIYEALEFFSGKFHKKFRVHQLVLSQRLRKTLGYAHYQDYGCKIFNYSITISTYIFKKNSRELKDTCYHEVAHVVDHQLYGNWGHGKTWKHLMITAGMEPKASIDRKTLKKLLEGRK